MINEVFLQEINQCRLNPRKYSSKLSKILPYFHEALYEKPGIKAKITKEGLSGIESCIKYLKTIRPSPPLKWSPSLYEAAKSHVQDIGPKGLFGHIGSDGSNLITRISKHCQWSGQIGENIDYGTFNVEDIVISFLIDDGMLARGQRLNIMKKNHKYVGAAIGSHSEKEWVCVMIFAEEVNDNCLDFTLDLDSSKDLVIDDNSHKIVDFSEICEMSGFDVEKSQSFNDLESEVGNNSEIFHEKTEGDFQLKNKTEENEISNISAFDKDIYTNAQNLEIDKNSSVLSFSVSKTQSSIAFNTHSANEKFSQAKKPPIDARLKKKKEEFKVSDFERSEISKEGILEIKELFDLHDSGSGLFDSETPKNIKEILESRSTIIQVLSEIDSNELKNLNFENFLDLYIEKLGLSSKKLSSLSLENHKNEAKSLKTIQNKRKNNFDPSLFSRPEFSKENIIEIKEAFDLFDVDNTGTINPVDLQVALKNHGFDNKNPIVYNMIAGIDGKELEKVNFGEFLDLLASEGVDSSSSEEIFKLFSLFDVEKTGFIELKNLKKIARELGETLDEQEIIEIIKKSDLDGDGRVSFEDFYNIMKKNPY